MPRAFHTDYPWANLDIEERILAEADCSIAVSPDNQEETLIKHVGDADVILTCWAKVTSRVIDSATNCRHIARTGIGLDNIDVEYATSKGILVTNVPDYCLQEVAEHALAMVFSLARKIATSHLDTKQGRYDLVATLPIDRIAGKTIGIVGLGGTGELLARMARAVGMRVIGHNRSQQVPDGVTWVTMHDLFDQSDYVSLNAPLTEQTHHLMNAEAFRKMKPTAFLINTARGGLVDHAALAAALEAGELAGAALDVQEVEPPDLSQAPYNDPRVIVTPHTAFCSPEAITELRTRVACQVVDYLQGRTPENVVNRLG